MVKEINISDNSKKEIPQEEPIVIKTEETVEKPIQEKEPKELQLPKQQKPKKEKKVLNFKFKNLILPIVAVLTLSGIALFYYFGIYKATPLNPAEVLPFNTNFISSIASAKQFVTNLTLLSKPEEPRTEESPLNGVLFTKSEMDILQSRRPVAVMINNHAAARPQSGLNSADIVIEANVESGITRYMAIFWSEAPEKVGPIRSIRQYYLEWLSEYDPIVIHDGCASSDDVRVNACGNIYLYGIKDIGTLGAWRWDDGRRYAPHNEYSSVEYAWEYAKKVDWDSFPTIESWEFKNDSDISLRGDGETVEVTFHTRLNNGELYDAIWTYDATTNSYFRKVGGQADMDQETSTQVSAKNVVIQEVEMINTGDDKAHIILTTIDEGDAIFLIDGNIEYGTWKKTSRTDRTTYYDSKGDEIEFNRGRIWISVIPHSVGKFDILE
jgi:hypothetical protein